MLQVNIASIFFIKKAEHDAVHCKHSEFNRAESNALTTQMLRQFSANANCKLLPIFLCSPLPSPLSLLPSLSLQLAPALWAKENVLNFECQAKSWRMAAPQGCKADSDSTRGEWGSQGGFNNRKRERKRDDTAFLCAQA